MNATCGLNMPVLTKHDAASLTWRLRGYYDQGIAVSNLILMGGGSHSSIFAS